MLQGEFDGLRAASAARPMCDGRWCGIKMERERGVAVGKVRG